MNDIILTEVEAFYLDLVGSLLNFLSWEPNLNESFYLHAD